MAKFEIGQEVRVKFNATQEDARTCLSLEAVNKDAGKIFIIEKECLGRGKSGRGYHLKGNIYWWNEELLEPVIEEEDISESEREARLEELEKLLAQF